MTGAMSLMMVDGFTSVPLALRRRTAGRCCLIIMIVVAFTRIILGELSMDARCEKMHGTGTYTCEGE